MQRLMPYFVVFLLPISVFGAAQQQDWRLALPIVISHLALPVLDHLVGRRKTNIARDMEKEEQESPAFSWLLWGYVPVQLAITVWLVILAPGLEPISFGALLLGLGISNGAMGINIAHELIHRQGKVEPLLGRLLLLCVCYTHWAVEHVRGHHRLVATGDDPATARQGQNVYSFWWQSLLGTVRSAWAIEKTRLHRQQQSVWEMGNEVLFWWGIQVLVLVTITIFAGPLALLFFLGQAVIAVLELENVNYIEHYGLQRGQDENGHYVPVRPEHSWNSDYRLTGWFLIELGRHSDHHANARRKYQILRSLPEAPLMPTGYGGMVVLAMVPPLWFWVMDTRLQQWKAHAVMDNGNGTKVQENK